jgi:exodeoxyribonuclease V alpha subunit
MSESGNAQLDLATGFGQVLESWSRKFNPTKSDEAAAIASHLRNIGEQLSLATTEGHSCLPLSAVKDIHHGESIAGLRAKLLASKLVGTPQETPAKPLILDDGDRLYLYRHFEQERRLARRLVERAQSPRSQITDSARLREWLDAYVGPSSPSGTNPTLDWQRIAVAQAVFNPTTFISGGPGTGKTRTAARLIECILKLRPGTRIALAAPTGKAASRLREALSSDSKGFDTFTLHRLLNVHPTTGRPQFHQGNPLPFDLVVVDEASMLDLTLALQLMSALPDDSQCVLLGDKDQLPPVEVGSVFATLSAGRRFSGPGLNRLAEATGYSAETIQGAITAAPDYSALTDQVVWLEKNYRFSDRSAIGMLSEAVKRGHTAAAIEILRDPNSVGLQWLEDNHSRIDTPTLRVAALGYAPYRTALERLKGRADERADGPAAGPAIQHSIRDQSLLEELFKAFDQFRVLAAIRQTGRGIITLNAQLRRLIDPGTRTWYPGRPILITRNDPALNLYNGDVGICLNPPRSDSDRDRPQVWFREQTQGDPSQFRAIDCERLPPHEDALAMTVHKAQGSEFESVLMVLPHEIGRTANRALLYTAITRARSRVMVSGSQSVLEAACLQADVRPSGLSERIRELIDASLSSSSG